jgi:hypothetical protein
MTSTSIFITRSIASIHFVTWQWWAGGVTS